jgi:hypothetical protein
MAAALFVTERLCIFLLLSSRLNVLRIKIFSGRSPAADKDELRFIFMGYDIIAHTRCCCLRQQPKGPSASSVISSPKGGSPQRGRYYTVCLYGLSPYPVLCPGSALLLSSSNQHSLSLRERSAPEGGNLRS